VTKMKSIAALLCGTLCVYISTLSVQASQQPKDICANVDCNAPNGNCVVEGGTFKCNCKNGFSGQFCQITPCETAGYPCKRESKCISCAEDLEGCNKVNPPPADKDNIYWCACKDNWQGRDCNTAREGNCNFITCGLKAWKIGGLCSLTADNQPQCNCFQGYSGSFCQTEDSKISVDPAVTTVVKGSTAKFSCENSAIGSKAYRLQKGPSWTLVDSGVDTKNKWQSNSVTFDTLGSHNYRCQIEIGGNTFLSSIITINVLDQEKSGQCQYITCKNGGNCVEEDGAPKCNCVGKWTGPYCTIDKSSQKPCTNAVVKCQNGGNCVEANGDFTCECQPKDNSNWFGRFCEKARPSVNAPCTKSSQCEGLKCAGNQIGYCKFGEFKCACKDNFGDISCGSGGHSVCANNCPANNEGKKLGLCLKTNKCICFLNNDQYFQYQIAYNFPSGEHFWQA